MSLALPLQRATQHGPGIGIVADQAASLPTATFVRARTGEHRDAVLVGIGVDASLTRERARFI
jgi:hypothetical protein